MYVDTHQPVLRPAFSNNVSSQFSFWVYSARVYSFQKSFVEWQLNKCATCIKIGQCELQQEVWHQYSQQIRTPGRAVKCDQLGSWLHTRYYRLSGHQPSHICCYSGRISGIIPKHALPISGNDIKGRITLFSPQTDTIATAADVISQLLAT